MGGRAVCLAHGCRHWSAGRDGNVRSHVLSERSQAGPTGVQWRGQERGTAGLWDPVNPGRRADLRQGHLVCDGMYPVFWGPGLSPGPGERLRGRHLLFSPEKPGE